MDKPLKLAIIGVCLTAILGIIYFFLTNHIASASDVLPYTTLVLEAFKTLLTFSLITTGGVVLKAYIDQILEKDRNKQTETNRYEETRKSLLKEFTTIYSEFYSIRKLYHSALSHNNIYEKNSDDFKTLIRQVLQKSVDLEGRYGALKVLAITHLNLPRGEYQKKNLSELKKLISIKSDVKEIARLKLDLLGEFYDDWRHAIENSRKIKVDDEFWKGYDWLLHFLEERCGTASAKGTSDPHSERLKFKWWA